MARDMTVGHPLKSIIPFFLSMAIAQVFTHLYGWVDTIVVGKYLGENALAAVGSTAPINFFLTGLLTVLPSSLSIYTGQRFGAKDMDGVRRSMSVSIIITAFVSVIGWLLTFFYMDELLTLMDTPIEIFAMTYSYIRIIMLGIPFTTYYFTLSSMMRSMGDSKRPVIIIIATSVLNGILDILFVCVFHKGVAGAAYATMISQAVSVVLCIIAIVWKFEELHPHRDSWKNPFKIYWDHLYIAIPLALQFTIMGLGAVIVQAALNQFGPKCMAGSAAGGKIESIIWLPLGSLGLAISPYVAQNFGAKRFDRIEQGIKLCWRFSICFSIVICALVMIFADPLLNIFLDKETVSEEVLVAGKQYIFRVAPFFVMLSMIVVFRSSIQGMGHSIPTLGGGFLEIICRLVAAYYLTKIWGYIGICYNTGLVCTVNGLFMYVVFHYLLKRHQRQQAEEQKLQSVKTETAL